MGVPDRSVLPDIRAHHVLGDGSELVVRTVQPRDATLLARGFAELSPGSRYQRFFTPKAGLSEAELHALTELDGESQYAIGVTTWDEEGLEVPIGVARYVRDPREHDLAEAAIVVIDSRQRRGIGRLLLGALATAAYEHGVRRFRAEVLTDNYAVHRLLRGIAAGQRVVARAPGSEEIELVLRPPTPRVDPLGAPSCALEAASRAGTQKD
jgi:RimJ/RimL family protein N-acetyltransferase